MSAGNSEADDPIIDPTLTVAPPSAIPDGRDAENSPNLTAGATASPFERRHGDLPPPTLPGYEVLAEVGRGGMGVVYRARQKGLNRLVALKVVLAGGHASTSQRLRFLAEAEAVAAISHPGIVGVYEFGTWEGQPFIALEFCPNGTLADRLLGTPMAPLEAASLVQRVALAVAAAHARGIVHRDLKPANVLLGTDGSPKVGDFGLAKLMESGEGLTASGAVMGTPSYMAPEQAKGEAKLVGPPADVYALGAVLYECLTGRPPFKGASAAETILQTLNQEPVAVRALNPIVPVDLETVCLKCLEKESARRYPTAQALADDLGRFLEGRPVVARPVGWLGRARRWVRRNRVEAALLAAVVLAIFGGTTATFIKYRAEAVQRAEADRARAEAQGEAVAKEQALQDLQTTLTTLKRLTEEQESTLRKLTQEKAATEDNLLRGLLRPLREPPVGTITLQETRALLELAGLPEERLRFLFIERALASPDRATKLSSWPQEIVGAVVGLDRAAALRLRAQLAPMLQAETLSAEARLACALLATALPADDPEFNRSAARVLIERIVAETNTNELDYLAAGVDDLVARLSPAEVAPLMTLFTQRFFREKDPSALANLEPAFAALAERLPVSELGPLARGLSDRIVAEVDVATLPPLVRQLKPLADRLGAPGTQLLALPTRVLADRLATEKDLNTLSTLTTPFTQLAESLEPAPAAAAARTLVARLVTEKDYGPLSYLLSPMTTLASRVAPEAARPLASSIVGRLLVEKDTSNQGILISHAQLLVERLSRAGAVQTLTPVLRQVIQSFAMEKDINLLSAHSSVLNTFGEYLTPSEAAEVVRAIVSRLTTEKDSSAIAYLCSGIRGVATLLPAGESISTARFIFERLRQEKDPTNIYQYGYTVPTLLDKHGLLAGWLVRDYTRQILDRLRAEKGSTLGSNLLNGVSTLPLSYLRVSDVADFSRSLVEYMLVERDSTVLSNLQYTLLRVSSLLSSEQVAEYAAKLTTRMAGEKDHNLHFPLAAVLTELYATLPPGEAAALAGRVARQQVNRIATERDVTSLYNYTGALVLIASYIEAQELSALVRPIMVRIGTEKDPTTLYHLCSLASNLVSRVQAGDAATLARAFAQRMLTEKDPSNTDRLAMVLEVLLKQTTEAEMVALLKPYLVFPPIRTAILNELGRRSRRNETPGAIAVGGPAAVSQRHAEAFANIWVCLDWVEKVCPELDLRVTPARMPSN